MDLEKWKKYENKEKELRKGFKKKRLILLLIWLMITAVINGTLLILKNQFGISLVITVMVFFNIISIFVFLKKIAELYRIEKQQVEFIEHDEPFGRFKT